MGDDDACLVGAARTGDRAAFARLIERHRPLLLRLGSSHPAVRRRG